MPAPPTHTEVICFEAGIKMLIRNTTSDDFWQAVENFDNLKKKRGTTEDYTVLVFKNKNSMQLKGIKSEDMMHGCSARNVNWDQIGQDYMIF